jgi:urease accessory protein
MGVSDLLMIWLSPAFPVGAFAFSHGLEKAVEDGLIRDAAGLAGWIADLTRCGSLHNDLVVLAAAWRANRIGDEAGLTQVADLALALQPSAERYLETVTQGNAFREAIRAAWPAPRTQRCFSLAGEDGRGGLQNGSRRDSLHPALTRRAPRQGQGADIEPIQDAPAGDIAYPIAVAWVSATHGIALGPTLLAYGLAFVSNLASAAIRLSLIGQTDGQRLIAELRPIVHEAARAAESSTLDALGSAAFASDLSSLRHETQYTRLFRS